MTFKTRLEECTACNNNENGMCKEYGIEIREATPYFVKCNHYSSKLSTRNLNMLNPIKRSFGSLEVL